MKFEWSSSKSAQCLIWLGLVALVWAVEIFILQELTFDSDYPGNMKTELVHCTARLFLDFTFSAAVVFLLPRWLLALTFVLYTVFFCGTCVYCRYFDAPPSLIVILAQSGEGATAWESVISFMDLRAVLGTIATLALQLWLLWKARVNSPHPPVQSVVLPKESTKSNVVEATSAMNVPTCWQVWKLRLAFGGACLLVYLTVFSVLAFKVRPIDGVGALNSFTDTGHVYGFIPVWIAEATYSMTPAKQLQLAIERSRETSDQISPQETPVALGRHVVVLQAESLDYEIIHWNHQGVPVMPFLRKLESQGYSFQLNESHHTSSSADADFLFLMGGNPIGRVCPYYIHDFPYQTEGHPLPAFVAQYGYQCDFMHGFMAVFFERDKAIAQMGFRSFFFMEQMETDGAKPSTVGWHGIPDGTLLDFAARKMNESAEPTVQFLITFSAHAPFNQLESKDFVKPFDKPTSEVESYFATMNYFDRSLERFVQSLPEDTVLFIYADHASGIAPYERGTKSAVFQPRLQNKTDRFIPAIVYCKGKDISAQQQTAKTGKAASREFNLLDFAMFFRKCVETSP